MLLMDVGSSWANTQVVVNNSAFRIRGVPIIKQFPELPTGCEATALTMLLRSFGVNVTKQEVANRLPKAAFPYYRKGIRYGVNPNEGFVGNPYNKSSYGVFEGPILQVINSYLPGCGENLTGKNFNEVLGIVRSGRPVMIWVTIGMDHVVYRQSWRLSNGGICKWPAGEHAVILIGYDGTYVYINDPYTGKEKKYKYDVVANRYNSLGKRAVTIRCR